MPLPPNSGNFLSGIAGLLNGFRKLKDPGADTREALMQQLMLNPELAQRMRDSLAPQQIDQLNGPNPLFGKRQYDIAAFLNSMPLSPQALEMQKVSGLQTREKLEDPALLTSIANAGKSVDMSKPEMAKITKDIKQGQATPYKLSDVERAKLEEYRKGVTGQLTSADVKEQQTRQKGLELNVKGQEIQNETNQFQLIDAKERKALEDQGRKAMAQLVAANKGKPVNLYELARSRQVPPETMNAIMAIPEFQKQYDRENDDFWKQRDYALRKSDLQNSMQLRKDSLVDRMVERSGYQIGREEANLLVNNPKALSDFWEMKATPTDPAQARVYKAAMAFKSALEAPMKKAISDLQTKTAGYINKIQNQKGLSDEEKLAQVQTQLDALWDSQPIEVAMFKPEIELANIDIPLGRDKKVIRIKGESEAPVKETKKKAAPDIQAKKAKRFDELAKQHPDWSDEKITQQVEKEIK